MHQKNIVKPGKEQDEIEQANKLVFNLHTVKS
jgi:hypothetical protein